ncbi:hypothetical protein F0562_027648 [Nyssa sinensis]|uniref:BHLH domain-containing protein n=1 Tax=Nyssa sinensis TaxID=561372 RepID=A0A5J5B7C5_9ASTE|nr:hypothetical protein F0562_027648 [Nyssa sinensis]
MADLHGTSARSSSLESEEMSSFLHNLLRNSSAPSPSCTSFKARHLPSFSSPPLQPPPPAPAPAPLPETTYTTGLFGRSATVVPDSDCGVWEAASTVGSSVMVDSTSGFNFSDPGSFFPADAKESTRKTFSSVGVVDSDAITSSTKGKKFTAENNVNDFSLDRERGPASEENMNPVPPRSSKRCRAAEVHNLSEKRRRSRINEKMKALQNLIPNSNKTDKASMLDEAIEYLKQLQLQVQMLSMRNGLSLHPFYLPGSLQPMQLPQAGMGFDEGNGLLNTNTGADTFPGNQEIPLRSGFDLSNQCTPSNEPIIIPPLTNITNPETSFGMEESIQNHYGRFNQSTSSKELCREDTLSQLQLDVSCSGKNSSSGLSS